MNCIDEHIKSIKLHLEEFNSFLISSQTTVFNQKELLAYLEYFNGCKADFYKYVSAMGQENSIHLYGTINAISRFFSEFNWVEDGPFYEKAQHYLNALTKEKSAIYNFYNPSA